MNGKVVEPDNRYQEPVYNEDIYEGFAVNSEPLNDRDVKLFNTAVNINNPSILFYGAYVYADNQYYVSKVVNVPVQIDNMHKMTDINLGLDKDGEKEIKFTCSGKIITGTTNSSIIMTAGTNGVAVQSWSSAGIPPQAYYPNEETRGNFTVPAKYEKTITNDDGSITVKAHIDIPTKDNLAETDVTAKLVTIDGKDYMQIDIQNLLCGIRISEVGGRGTALPFQGNKTALSGNIGGGTYIEYIPESVTITIYGNTIGIKLVDKTITIGEGKNVMSFQGNELMQIK